MFVQGGLNAKTLFICSVSHFNLGGLGALFGGITPPKPPVATGLHLGQIAIKPFNFWSMQMVLKFRATAKDAHPCILGSPKTSLCSVFSSVLDPLQTSFEVFFQHSCHLTCEELTSGKLQLQNKVSPTCLTTDRALFSCWIFCESL